MIVRKAQIKDAKACYELSKIRELLNAYNEPVPFSYFQDVIRENRSIILVAEENKKIIGYISIDLLPAKVAVIWFISVHPNHQNRGIGKILLATAEKECKKRGHKYLISYAIKFNEKTLKFYKKQGFNFGEEMIEIQKNLD